MATKLKTRLAAYQPTPGLGASALKGLKPAAPKPFAGIPGPAAGAGLVGASTPAPTAAPLPWDANYETRIGGINRDVTSSLAGIDNEETAVKQAYGFDDVSNPFNRLAMLKEAFANQQRGTTNSMAAAGQLYSSALQDQRGADQHGYDVSYDTERRNYQGALDGLAARRTGIKNQGEDDTTAAGWERTQAALQNRPDPASVPAAAPAPAAAAPAAAKDFTVRPGTDSKGRAGVWHDYKDGRKPVFVPRG